MNHPARRAMTLRRALIAVVSLFVAASPVSAHNVIVAGWESSSESTSIYCGYLRHWQNDTCRAGTTFWFSTTKAANMRHNRNHASRYFTLDSVDISHNLDAWTISTTVPNAFNDLEDDNGDGKREEAEVVSESTTFPVANTTYATNAYFSHSYICQSGTWCYDEGAGTISFWENLSLWTVCCWPRDKYDTDGNIASAPVNPSRSYPSWNYPYGFNGPETAGQTTHTSDPESTETIALGARPYGVLHKNSAGGSVLLSADVSGGLDAYAGKARGLAKAVVRKGDAQGVLTFSRTVQRDSLTELRAVGLEIGQIEVVSTPDSDGLRWTFFGPDEPSFWALVFADTEDAGVEVLGITSAQVTVPSAEVLRAASGRPDVFLIDLSIEDFERMHPGIRAAQNDLFWQVMGWN